MLFCVSAGNTTNSRMQPCTHYQLNFTVSLWCAVVFATFSVLKVFWAHTEFHVFMCLYICRTFAGQLRFYMFSLWEDVCLFSFRKSAHVIWLGVFKHGNWVQHLYFKKENQPLVYSSPAAVKFRWPLWYSAINFFCCCSIEQHENSVFCCPSLIIRQTIRLAYTVFAFDYKICNQNIHSITFSFSCHLHTDILTPLRSKAECTVGIANAVI